MLKLLSTNQSKIKLMFLLRWISITLMSLYKNIKQVSYVHKSSSHLTACSMPFIYRKNRSGPKIDPHGTPHKSCPAFEKYLFNFTLNFLYDR